MIRDMEVSDLIAGITLLLWCAFIFVYAGVVS